jgi:hypothetical protein
MVVRLAGSREYCSGMAGLGGGRSVVDNDARRLLELRRLGLFGLEVWLVRFSTVDVLGDGGGIDGVVEPLHFKIDLRATDFSSSASTGAVDNGRVT